MQVTDPPPVELDLIPVVSWVVKMGIINPVNRENLIVMFTVSIMTATLKLHFSKSFFFFCFELPSYTLTKANVFKKSSKHYPVQYKEELFIVLPPFIRLDSVYRHFALFEFIWQASEF